MYPTDLTLRLLRPSSTERFLSKGSEKRLARNLRASVDTSKIQLWWDGLDGKSRSISIPVSSLLQPPCSPEQLQGMYRLLVCYLSGLANLYEEVKPYRIREWMSASSPERS